jgi:hypothetical protein
LAPDGQITILSNGQIQDVSPSGLLHSDYRYVDTVHSSQGQTADYCIYSAAPANSLTIGRESFYVAASRAKSEFVVYTASSQDLGVTIQQSRESENALDLVNPSVSREEASKKKRTQRAQPTQTAAPQPENQSNWEPSLTEQQSSLLSDEPRYLSIEEHRHIARIVRCQIRQSALATQIIWKAYGTYAPATKEAYNWWRAADRLLVALDELSSSVKNLYYVELPDCQKTWYKDEIAADQLALLEPLLKFYPSDEGFQPLEDGCGINISYP